MKAVKSETTPILAEISIWWLVFATMSIVMGIAAPHGVFQESSLSLLNRLSVACTEPMVLGLALVLICGLPALLHRIALRRGWTRIAALGKAWMTPACAVLLLGCGLSWACFCFTGQFVGYDAIEFFFNNLRIMSGYLLHVHGLHLVGFLILCAPAFVAVRALRRRFIGRLSGAALARCVRLGGGLAGLMGIFAFGIPAIAPTPAGAEERPDGGGRRWNPTYHQTYRSGPTAHLLAALIRRGDERPPRVAGQGPGASVLRPPALPLQEYLSTVEEPPADPPNVVLILVDSLRADQLVAFGGSGGVMPTLEALAKESRLYSDCMTQAPHTDYAAPSLFSSQYPLRGPRIHRYSESPPYPRVMIYDVLGGLGYRTGLFSSQDERWGGMISYLDTGGLDTISHPGLDEGTGARSGAQAAEACRDDGITVRAAVEWIDRDPDAPFCLGLNLQNAHSPYHLPAGSARPFGSDPEDHPEGFGRFSPREATRVKSAYADSLAYVDAQIEFLLRYLGSRGILRRTVLVVTSDHGEAFYEHGLTAHGNGLFQELVRIPLLVRAPGLSPGTDARPAELIDVAPSLLHLLGLPPHPGFQGRTLFAEEANPDRCRFLVAHTPAAHQYAVVRSRMKLIFDARRGTASLFDLEKDPKEQDDLARVRIDLTDDLTAVLTAWYESQIDYYSDVDRRRVEYPPVLSFPGR